MCSDIDDFEALSLEGVKSRAEYNEKMKDANHFKIELMETLKGLERKYEALLRRNSKLPVTQQLSPMDLILDPRIEEDIANLLDSEMEAVKFKLAWSLEKIKTQHRKVNDYFIKPLENYPIKVTGINDEHLFVESFRLKRLGTEFKALKEMVLIKQEEQEAKGR